MTNASQIPQLIAQEIGAQAAQVTAAIQLLDEGATVPFIARYRKEVTGGLDDTQLRNLAERLTYLREMQARRAAIVASITEQGKMTDALALSLVKATTKAELEDIYLPYKPKRRTRAMIARENGLQPLYDAILTDRSADPATLAAGYISEAVPDAKTALEGARGVRADAGDVHRRGRGAAQWRREGDLDGCWHRRRQQLPRQAQARQMPIRPLTAGHQQVYADGQMIEKELQTAVQHGALGQVVVIQHYQHGGARIELLCHLVEHPVQPLFIGKRLMTLTYFQQAHGLITQTGQVAYMVDVNGDPSPLDDNEGTLDMMALFAPELVKDSRTVPCASTA